MADSRQNAYANAQQPMKIPGSGPPPQGISSGMGPPSARPSMGPPGPGGPTPSGNYNNPSGMNVPRGYNQGPPHTANGAHPTNNPPTGTTGYRPSPIDHRSGLVNANSGRAQTHSMGGYQPTGTANSTQGGRGAPMIGYPVANSRGPPGNPPSMPNQYSGPSQPVNSYPGPHQAVPSSSAGSGPPSRVAAPPSSMPLPGGSLPGGPGNYGRSGSYGGPGTPPVSMDSPSTPDGSGIDRSFNSSGPPSARSSAAPSPVPSMRYDALEGGTPYTSNFYQGPPTPGTQPAGSQLPISPLAAPSRGPPLSGPQLGAPQTGAPQMGAPQMGAPQMSGPQMGGPQMGGPQMGAPPMGGPQMGGPQMGGPQMGGPPTGPPQMGGPPTSGPPLGGPQMGGGHMGGPPSGGPPVQGGPPFGAPSMGGPPTSASSSGVSGRRQYPQPASYQQPPPVSQGSVPPGGQNAPGMMGNAMQRSGVAPQPNGGQAGPKMNNIMQQPGGQPTMNNINASMGNLKVQQGDTRPMNLLQQRHIVETTPVEPPKSRLSPDYQKLQVDPDIFRSTLNAIPQTNGLLQKSRMPLGLLIHPFRDLSHLPVIQSSVIVRCRSCRTYINPFVTIIEQRRWKCNLCYRINDLPEEFTFDPVTKSYGSPERRPEIKSATIEFIAPSEYMLRPPQPAVYLFVLDVSFSAVESGYLTIACQNLMDCLDKMPGDARTLIGFITFDSTLHFYSLQEGMTRPQMMVVSDIDDVFLPCPNDLLVNVQENRELIDELLNQLPSMFTGNKNTQTALGPALQAALKLMSPTGGRVTVFQSGLPSLGAGALKSREDPNQRASTKNVPNLGPAVDFYKKLSLDFSAQQIACDIFLFSGQYTDVATLAGVAKYSGGSVHYYPGFNSTQNLVEVERFGQDFRRYLTRKIGFEAVMRIRCTKGLSIHTFHGNFFVRSTDLLSLPNINPDAGFAMQVSIEESLHDSPVASFQAALLYTSSKGERRIRVHTMCLPVSNQMTEIIAGADQQGIMGLLTRMAVDKSQTSNMSDARDALVNVCVDSLSMYKATLPSSHTVGTLMCPQSLRMLPSYTLAALKNVAFRLGSSTRLDERVYAMEMIKCQPLQYIMLRLHPNMYPVHNMSDEGAILINDQSVPQPPILGLTSEYIERNGAYLLDCGDAMILFVNRAISISFCMEILDVPNFQSIPEEMVDLPELANQASERLRTFILWLLDKRSCSAPLQIIREDSKKRTLFLRHLTQDRTESSMSYYEFLQHLQKEIK
ncbi:protein transport protein Sec24A-like [Asterias rubens]|uniref:protein transport protein Sec24A-like n=1 Tax=Asterias rubens TaxID=7604 RepID=UPI001454F854|nr:protein transport protein Sec24A-like [Asterias rubens]